MLRHGRPSFRPLSVLSLCWSCILLSLLHTQYVGVCDNHSFTTTDRQLSLLHIRRGDNRCGIPQFKLCWASCMFYPCILHCKPAFFFHSFGQTLSWGSVCLINAFRGRNNRMDLSNEPPTTYVTTVPVDTESPADDMDSLTRRYVLTQPSVEHDNEQSC